MLRLGDVVSRHGVDPTDRGRPGRRHRAPLPPPRRGRRRHRGAGQGDQRDPPRRERRRDRRPHPGGDRRARRGHRRPGGGAPDLRRGPRLGGARSRARGVLRPRWRQPRGDGRRRQQPDVGHQRAARRRPPHRRATSTPTRSPSPTAARCATRIVEVLAPVVARGRDVRTQARGRQQRHAREPGRDGRRAARRGRPGHAEPAHDHRGRSSSTLHKELLASKAAERLRFEGLDARRVDLIVAGSMVLATAMELFDLDQLTISEWALREGIVLDAVGRHDPADWSDDPHAIRRERGARAGPALQLGRGPRPPGGEARARPVRRHRARARPRRRRPRAARVRRAAARHRRARREQRAPQARRVPRAQRSAPGLLPRRDRAARRRSCAGTGAASRASATSSRCSTPTRSSGCASLAAILRVADGLDRSRNQNVYGLDAMVTPSLVLLRVRDPRRRRARGLGRAPQACAPREGARPRARAHDPSVRWADRTKGWLPCGPFPIGDDRVGASTTGDEIVVRSPYDGHEIDRVPGVRPRRGRARGRARGRRCTAPVRCPRGSAPRSSTAPRGCSAERTEEFARIIAEEAAKPIKTARVEANRAVSTFTFAATEARRLAGEMVPLDAADVGEGKLGFTLRVPVGVVGAISPFNFPLNLVAHKLAPAIAAGCPVVLKPASQTPLSAIALAELLLDECGLPAGHLNVVTGGGGTVGNAHRRRPRHRAHHVHRLARGRVGHPRPRAAQEGRPRARQQRAGHHRARRRRHHRGHQDLGGRLQPRRAVVHLDPAHLPARGRSPTRSSTCSCRGSTRSWSATRSTRPPTCRR